MLKKQGGEPMNRLRELREERDLKQKDIAKLINKTIQAYSLYERGERNIDNDVLKKLSDFYGVSIGYLLGTEPQPNQFNLQIFGNPNAPAPNVTYAFGQILTLKDEKAKNLTLQIMEDVLHLTIPQLEALSALIKTIK
jgi:transcriptional regulator with XRE-family HTH domain